MTKEIKQTKDIQTVIDELAIKGVEALNEMADFTQEQVDYIVHHASKMTRQSVLLLKIKSKVWSLSLSR